MKTSEQAADRAPAWDVQTLICAGEDKFPCIDVPGASVTSESALAVRALERSVWAIMYHRVEAAEALKEALELDPELALAHVLRGFQLRLLARAELAPAITEAIARARASVARRGAGAREHMLLDALATWHAGDASRAQAILRGTCEAHPRCLLSMKLLHALSLMYGKLKLTPSALERSLGELTVRSPNRGVLLGCYAFALHESGFVAGAREAALRALEISPDDVWALHALLHALTGQQRFDEAAEVLARWDHGFVRCNNFRAHLVWHRALLAVARGAYEEALALHDRELVRVFDPARALNYRDLANCVSMLVRLERVGVDVGARYEALADLAEGQRGDHRLAFADAHYLLALLRAGRAQAARRFLAQARAEVCARRDEDAQVYARRGVPLLEGLSALYLGERNASLRALASLNAAQLAELGGSNMQRELFLQLSQDAHQRWRDSEARGSDPEDEP